jgi:transcriptional regulator with XRE-family HTH domain
VSKKIVIQESLRSYLELKSLSQSKLATACGISTSSLHGYLNGTLPKSLMILIKLSESLGVGLDELVFGEKPIVHRVDGISLWEITGKYELIITKKE